MKTRRKTTKTFTSLPYLLAPSHLFNRARLGGPGCFLTSQAARGRDPVAASLMENRLYKFCLKKIRFWK